MKKFVFLDLPSHGTIYEPSWSYNRTTLSDDTFPLPEIVVLKEPELVLAQEARYELEPLICFREVVLVMVGFLQVVLRELRERQVTRGGR